MSIPPVHTDELVPLRRRVTFNPSHADLNARIDSLKSSIDQLNTSIQSCIKELKDINHSLSGKPR